MTSPRSQLVDPTTPGYYHCVSRCVRRAWLCGVDEYTGESFEHRRQWVEERIRELGEVFPLGVSAYAVMSNHLHVVVKLEPGVAWSWSAEEVARRWATLFPVRESGEVDSEATARRVVVIAADPERVARYPERLARLSWFMRCLNEPIAPARTAKATPRFASWNSSSSITRCSTTKPGRGVSLSAPT